MNKGSTHFLRGVIVVMGLAVLALCIFGLPVLSKDVTAYIGMPNLHYVVLLGLYATAVLFFMTLHQSLKLLGFIDRNTAFSELSVTALRAIKRNAAAMSFIYLLGMPIVFQAAQIDDAPGLVVFGFVFACIPFVIGVFAALLQKLLQNAIEMKSENELTV